MRFFSRFKYFSVFGFLLIGACNNIKDASPEPRNSFLYFYSFKDESTIKKENTFCSMSALDADGGYITIGFRAVSPTEITAPKMFLLKTDARGKTLWQKDSYPDSLYGRSIRPVSDGYLVTADRIKVSIDNATSTTTTSYSINIFKMDLQGNIVLSYGNSPSASANFLSHAVNTDDQGNVVALATKITGLNNRNASIYRFGATASGFQLLGVQDPADPQNRNYSNGRAVFFTNSGSIIWPTSITNPLTGRSYAAFPNIVPGTGPGATPVTNQNVGETDDLNQRIVSDMKKNSFGFGALGTSYQLTSGNAVTARNFFFTRLSSNGTLVQNGALYYDGGVRIDDPSISTIEDAGITLTPAIDGGYLLVGYLETDPAQNRGNGGKDVLLVKVDAVGNVQWTKTYGGIGDEEASSTFQTADGGYVITGTSTIQGFASMFLIKTNSLGELKD